MPFVFEQKYPANKTVEKQPQRSNLRRLSAIPRPVKQLVVEPTGGISHASKPTVDRLPLPTPSKDAIRTKHNNHQDEKSKQQSPSGDSDAELAILDLIPFSRQPIVNFGDVKLGTTKIRHVVLRNSNGTQQQLFVKSFPKADKGFYMDATEFLIAPNTEICVTLAWTPRMIGGCRESITLQDVNRMPKRVILMGTAVRPKPEPSLTRTNRSIPRLFRRSPAKINRQMRQERNKLVFSPRQTHAKPDRLDKKVKHLTKLLSPSPKKRHPLVRTILSQYDGQKATIVQSYFRMIIERRRLQAKKEALIKIQSYFRMIIERQRLQACRAAATKIQSYFRMLLAQRQLVIKREAVVEIQSYWRMLLEKRRLANRKKSLIKIQAYSRMVIERRRYLKRTAAIVSIQAHWRMVLERRKFTDCRAAVIKIQSFCRMIVAKRKYHTAQAALLKIQSYWRMILVKRELRRQKAAATKIQSYCRMVRERRRFKEQQMAAVRIQSLCRMVLEKKRYETHRSAIIMLQACFRMVIAKRRLVQLRAARQSAALTLQKHYRAKLARKELARLKRLNLLVLWFQTRSRGYMYRNRLSSSIQALQRIQLTYCV